MGKFISGRSIGLAEWSSPLFSTLVHRHWPKWPRADEHHSCRKRHLTAHLELQLFRSDNDICATCPNCEGQLSPSCRRIYIVRASRLLQGLQKRGIFPLALKISLNMTGIVNSFCKGNIIALKTHCTYSLSRDKLAIRVALVNSCHF